jgi:hypothetical protein
MTSTSIPSSLATFEDMARRFALGELDDKQRLDVEERLVVDPEAHETLLLVADDLAEDYLDGALSERERRGFEQHYLAAGPEPRKRLQLLAALRSKATAAGQPRPVATPPPVTPRAASIGRLARVCLEYPQWASAALVALMVWSAFGGWLAIERVRQPGVTRPRNNVQTVPPAEVVPRGTPAPSPTTRVDRGAHERQADRPASAVEVDRPTPSPAVKNALPFGRPVSSLLPLQPVFRLRTGLQRSAGDMPRVLIPAGATIVQLDLELPPPAAGSSAHRATIVDPDGEPIYQVALRGVVPGTRATPLSVPTIYLPRGDYRVVVTAPASDGTAQTVATFPFRVLPEPPAARHQTPP